jgi:hypothetical protein
MIQLKGPIDGGMGNEIGVRDESPLMDVFIDSQHNKYDNCLFYTQ